MESFQDNQIIVKEDDRNNIIKVSDNDKKMTSRFLTMLFYVNQEINNKKKYIPPKDELQQRRNAIPD